MSQQEQPHEQPDNGGGDEDNNKSLLPIPESADANSTELVALDKGSNSNSNKPEESQPTRPKRPLSAYNLFFQAERSKILEALPVRAQGKPRQRCVWCSPAIVCVCACVRVRLLSRGISDIYNRILH